MDKKRSQQFKHKAAEEILEWSNRDFFSTRVGGAGGPEAGPDHVKPPKLPIYSLFNVKMDGKWMDGFGDCLQLQDVS